jgi:hypothetical protein
MSNFLDTIIVLIIIFILYALMSLIVKMGYGLYLACLLSIGCLLVGGFGIYFAYSFGKALAPISNISRYREVRRYANETWGRNDPTLIEHFPSDIPNDARGVIFYHQHFLKGGGTIQLRMKLLPERVEEIQARFQLMAKLKYIPGSKDNSINVGYSSREGVMILDDYISLTDRVSDRPFPEILVLEDTSVGYDFLQRGCSYGVSIDSSTSEVIYWAMVHSD